MIYMVRVFKMGKGSGEKRMEVVKKEEWFEVEVLYDMIRLMLMELLKEKGDRVMIREVVKELRDKYGMKLGRSNEDVWMMVMSLGKEDGLKMGWSVWKEFVMEKGRRMEMVGMR